jgi:hypothetical protein
MAEYFHTWDLTKQTAANELLGRIGTLDNEIDRLTEDADTLRKKADAIDRDVAETQRIRDEYQAIVDFAEGKPKADTRGYRAIYINPKTPNE